VFAPAIHSSGQARVRCAQQRSLLVRAGRAGVRCAVLGGRWRAGSLGHRRDPRSDPQEAHRFRLAQPIAVPVYAQLEHEVRRQADTAAGAARAHVVVAAGVLCVAGS